MITHDIGVISRLDDRELLRAIDQEPPEVRTVLEKELARRLEIVVGDETAEEVEARLEKSYESAMEQSDFRRDAIAEILELCSQPGTKKELVKAIEALVENSYVEL